MINESLLIAQDTIIMAAAAGSVPQLDIVFSDGTVNFCKSIAAIAAICWVFYMLFRNILPGGRGGGQGMQALMGQGMTATKVVGAIIGIIALMDINLTVDITNFVLEQLWGVKETVQNGGGII